MYLCLSTYGCASIRENYISSFPKDLNEIVHMDKALGFPDHYGFVDTRLLQ